MIFNIFISSGRHRVVGMAMRVPFQVEVVSRTFLLPMEYDVRSMVGVVLWCVPSKALWDEPLFGTLQRIFAAGEKCCWT